MKARIERERIPPGEDPQFHLKLGRGSLSDVEFTVQLEQLEHGGRHPEVRDPSTLAALDALTRHRRDRPATTPTRCGSRSCCASGRATTAISLRGTPGDALPADDDEAEKLARMLGYTHRPSSRSATTTAA